MLALVFPLLQCFQEALRIAEIGFITAALQRVPNALEAVVIFFSMPGARCPC